MSAFHKLFNSLVGGRYPHSLRIANQKSEAARVASDKAEKGKSSDLWKKAESAHKSAATAHQHAAIDGGNEKQRMHDIKARKHQVDAEYCNAASMGFPDRESDLDGTEYDNRRQTAKSYRRGAMQTARQSQYKK